MIDSPEQGTPVAEETLLGGEEIQDTAETPWYESLPEELKNEPTVQKYKTVEEAAKGLVNAVKMIGRDKVVVPKPDADPSEWESFFDAVGRPKTPDEYKVELENADGDFLKSFKDAAHRSGLNQQQVDGLLSFWNEATERAVEKMRSSWQAEITEGVEALKKDWGTAFDREVAVAKRAVRSLCDEEQMELLNEGLGNDPRIVKLFNRLGKMMGEDTLKALPDSTTVVESAQAEITRLKGDASFIQKLNDKMSPGHREAVEQFRILHERAFPTE